jgi:hypothetical protein
MQTSTMDSRPKPTKEERKSLDGLHLKVLKSLECCDKWIMQRWVLTENAKHLLTTATSASINNSSSSSHLFNASLRSLLWRLNLFYAAQLPAGACEGVEKRYVSLVNI